MKQKLIVIDNYDSFTFNLVEYLRDLTGDDPVVVRNDSIPLESLEEYDIIILSPRAWTSRGSWAFEANH